MSCINKKLFDQIHKIKNEFLSKKGEFRIEYDEKRAVNDSDAFYGAEGCIMNLCVLKGTPVMVWDEKLAKNVKYNLLQ